MNSSKTVFVIGATGLIGRRVVIAFLERGFKPIVLSRNPLKAKNLFGSKVDCQPWNGYDVDALKLLIIGSNAVVNLAGESIAVCWTRKRKEVINKSRIVSTNAIVEAIKQCSVPPKVFIQASAIGYYPHDSSLPIDEGGQLGEGFLSKIVMQWEHAAERVENSSRLVIIRTGVVLSADGGFLSKIVTPVKFFIGGWFGRGNQIVSWIHIKDHVRATCFLLENENCMGIYNLVSGEPTTIKTIVKRVGVILNRPVWLPIPSFLLKMIFGEMANEVILSNQYIIPQRLIQSGFSFKYSNIENALEDLLVISKS